jgi:hypothetical protein
MPVNKRVYPAVTGKDLNRLNKKIARNNKIHIEKTKQLIKKYVDKTSRDL